MKHIEATIKGKRYLARVIDGKVVQLHRVLPVQVLVGSEYVTRWDGFKSISANAKGRAELDAEILKAQA